MNLNFKPPISPLFVPGDKPNLIAKAAQSGADAIIIDLEDAVAPAAKASARDLVNRHGIHGIPVIVRVNAHGTVWHKDDLSALASGDIAAIMLPKSETRASIDAVKTVIGRSLPIIPLVESAAGLNALSDLLNGPEVVLVAFGSLDYALDLDCMPDWEPLLSARSEIVLKSRLAGLPGPLDGVTTNLTDAEATSIDALRARSLGFRGKLAIHPKQIKPIRLAMTPSPDEIAWAEKIIAATKNISVSSVDGAMVDAPVIARAKRILDI